MGRLDYPRVLFVAYPFDSYCSDQYVRSKFDRFYICTNTVQKVTRHGMGKDIWNVPFEDITLMLKVRSGVKC